MLRGHVEMTPKTPEGKSTMNFSPESVPAVQICSPRLLQRY